MKLLLFLFGLLAFACAAEDRHVLGHRAAYPKGWTRGAQTTDGNVRFTVALTQQNLDRLEELFWAVSTPGSDSYRNFMTIEEIDALVNPTAEAKFAVVNWLKANGVTSVEDRGDNLYVQSSVAVAAALFQTTFYSFTCLSEGPFHGAVIVRQWGSFSVPTAIKDLVHLVVGLSEFPIPKYRLHSGNQVTDDGTPVVIPQTVSAMYNIPAGTVATAGSQSVIEFQGQSYDPAELGSFASALGLKVVPPTAAHTIGSNDPSSPQIEATLDIQYVAGVGLGVENWFWLEDYSAWLYGFATHMYKTTPAPMTASISYGWNEQQQCEDGIGAGECQQLGVDSAGYVTAVNAQFQKIGLRGISLFAASGDSGANGRTDEDCSENHLNPDYPAASPFLTSVGATQVANPKFALPKAPALCTGQGWSCISAGTEDAVSFDVANFASGGGFSSVATMPAYQKTAVTAYLKSGVALPPLSYYNVTGRGYPDVAAFGNNVLIYTGGSWMPVGGTSAASPIWCGVTGLLNDIAIKKTGKPLGFMNPLLYTIAAACPDCFQDVTVGDNKCTESGCSSSCQGFECTKGWDPVTGLGSPNYQKLAAYIQAHL